MHLITAYESPCEDCNARGERADEQTPCPTCDGCGVKPVAHVVDGRLYKLFAGTPLEVENAIHAENILVHKAYQGVVAVKTIKQGYNTLLDVDGSMQLSIDRIRRSDETSLAEYIRIQQEGPIAAGRPPQVPTGRYLEAINRMGVKLEDYGIRPPGYGMAEASQRRDKQEEQLRNERDRMALEIGELRQQVAAMTGRLDELLAQGGQPAPAKEPAAADADQAKTPELVGAAPQQGRRPARAQH